MPTEAKYIDQFKVEDLRTLLDRFCDDEVAITDGQQIWIIYDAKIKNKGALYWLDTAAGPENCAKHIPALAGTELGIKEFCEARLFAVRNSKRSVTLAKDGLDLTVEIDFGIRKVTIIYKRETVPGGGQGLESIAREWTVNPTQPGASVLDGNKVAWTEPSQTTNEEDGNSGLLPPSTNAQPATTASAQQD